MRIDRRFGASEEAVTTAAEKKSDRERYHSVLTLCRDWDILYARSKVHVLINSDRFQVPDFGRIGPSVATREKE
jgi:hypothetical protein